MASSSVQCCPNVLASSNGLSHLSFVGATGVQSQPLGVVPVLARGVPDL